MMDLHTHLDLYPNALQILSKVNDINYFTLAVTTSPRAWIATKKVFSGYNNIEIGLGLHPEIAAEKFNELELLLASVSQSNFIGEVGIDGSAKYLESLTQQEMIFDKTIKECQKVGGRIISIHSRQAASKVLEILRKYPDNGKPILHWFSGSIAELNAAVEMKCNFSINPLMVKSKRGKDLISRIPINLILPESDGPFATINGKPIMPWEAMDICSVLSEFWHMPVVDVEEQIKSNFAVLIT
jgi:TatD DNase family protein